MAWLRMEYGKMRSQKLTGRGARKGVRHLLIVGEVALILGLVVGVFLPALLGPRRARSDGHPERQAAHRCLWAMNTVARAIASYRAENGEWPVSLEALRRDFIQSMPRCPLGILGGEPNYLYEAPDGGDHPVLSCERHWRYGYDFYVPRWDEERPRARRIQKPAREGTEPSATEGAEAFLQCQSVLASVASALRAYLDDTGRLPRGLAELVPGYLAQLPHCSRDFVKGRISYPYTAVGNGGIPFVTCERHWDYGFDLVVNRQFQVTAVRKERNLELKPLP
jgi:hypothetical protein